jgi:hypothetical protein
MELILICDRDSIRLFESPHTIFLMVDLGAGTPPVLRPILI